MFQTRDAAFNTIKYAGRSRAIVLDNNDPLKKGRIIVDHPLLGETVWIPYLAIAGCFSVPEIGDVVYVECDAGFETHPVAWGNLNTGEDSLDVVPDAFQRITPTNRGFYTPGGHLIEFDDGSDPTGTKKGIRLTTSEGSLITINEEPTDNSINIETISGAKINIDGTNDAITAEVTFGDNIELSAANGFQVNTPAAGGTHLSQKSGKFDITGNVQVTAQDGNGNTFTMDASGVDISDSNGNEIAMTASGVKVTDSAGGELNISSGMVALGGSSAELLDLVDQLIDQVDQTEDGIIALTVPTAVGPSGPPINSATFVGIKANLATIKGLLSGIKGSL